MSSTELPNILHQPILPPPPGQVSNFENPRSRANAIYVAAGICLPLIIVFAVLRFYAKLKVIKRKTWDDLTCALGATAGITFICLTVGAVAGGAYGSHSWDVKIGQFTKGQLLLSLLVESLYGPCIWLIKLSLFVLYLEIFGSVRWLRHGASLGIILTGIFYLSSMIIFIVYCGPKHGQSQLSYLSALASPRCTQTRQLVLALGIINVISDLYLIALPLPAVWALQMPLRRKIGVAAMILTGLIACIASALGLVYRINGNRSSDNTWEVVPVWTTTIIEMAAGVLVCCMPAITSVFRSCFSRFKSGSPGSTLRSLLPFKIKSAQDSARTGSFSELQLTATNSAYHFKVLAGQHDRSPSQTSRDDHLEFNEARQPVSKNHIHKTTNIHVV